MNKDVEVIARVLIDAFKDNKRQEHKTEMANKVVAIGQSDNESLVYIKDYQKASIHQLLMEFYRIMHRDKPDTLFSDVEKALLKKFGVSNVEFLTVERFDNAVVELLNAIRSYHLSEPDAVQDDFVGFNVKEAANGYVMTRDYKQTNIVTYLLAEHSLFKKIS